MATLTKEPWVTGEVITASKLNKTTDGGKYILTLSDEDYDNFEYSFTLTLDEDIPLGDFLGMIIIGKLQNAETLDLATRDTRIIPYFKSEISRISLSNLEPTRFELYADNINYSYSAPILGNKIYYFPESHTITTNSDYNTET